MAEKATPLSESARAAREARRNANVTCADFIVLGRRKIRGIKKGGVVSMPLNAATACLVEAHAIERAPVEPATAPVKSNPEKAPTPAVKKGS